MEPISIRGQDYLTTEDMTMEKLEILMNHAHLMRRHTENNYSRGYLIPSDVKGRHVEVAFFEDSTRTWRKSRRAAQLVGCSIDGFHGTKGLATNKGEGFEDTIKMYGYETDLLVIRHPVEGSAWTAAEICECPVVNGGDGANQHPTQAGQDLQAMLEYYRAFSNPTGIDWDVLQNKKIGFVGDARNSRPLHSSVPLWGMLGMKLVICSFPELKLAEPPVGIECEETDNLEETLKDCDIIYMTRIQFNRPGMEQYQHLKGRYVLTRELIERVNPNALIMHPLPRDKGDDNWTNCEIQPDVDSLKGAIYDKLQVQCGIWFMMALYDLLIRAYK